MKFKAPGFSIPRDAAERLCKAKYKGKQRSACMTGVNVAANTLSYKGTATACQDHVGRDRIACLDGGEAFLLEDGGSMDGRRKKKKAKKTGKKKR